MKWLGYKRVAFTSVKTDQAEIRARSKAAHVADLAQSIRDAGDELIHAPTIRMPGKRLVCGRDRMAALSILKAKRLWVRLCECSDEEAADLEAIENVQRRQDSRTDVLARAVRAKENLLSSRDMASDRVRRNAASTEEYSQVSEKDGGTVSRPPSYRVIPASRASQDSPRAEARRQIARAAGVTTEAVRKAQQRAAARQREKTSAEGSSASLPPGAPAAIAEEPAFSPPNLKLLGCDDNSTRAVCKFARPLQDAIDDADKHLRLALSALKPVEFTDVGQELRRQVQRVGDLVRSHRPESICPWCKGLPKATFGVCGGCNGRMFVTAEKAMTAPPECFFVDPPQVVFNGQLVPYADAAAGKLPKNGATARGGKRISAQDEAGNDIPLGD